LYSGIATDTNPKKLEKQLMELTNKKDFGGVGLGISFCWQGNI